MDITGCKAEISKRDCRLLEKKKAFKAVQKLIAYLLVELLHTINTGSACTHGPMAWRNQVF